MVSDCGMGIVLVLRLCLFMCGVWGDDVVVVGGLGLGFYIVECVMLLYGGSVEVVFIGLSGMVIWLLIF